MGRPMTECTCTASHPNKTKQQNCFLLFVSLTVLILVASHILLTLYSVGLSLYLQSRFLYTFDNQIIYVIKKTKIYIYLPVKL